MPSLPGAGAVWGWGLTETVTAFKSKDRLESTISDFHKQCEDLR